MQVEIKRLQTLEELVDIIHFGASPRATIDMFKAVKANAYLRKMILSTNWYCNGCKNVFKT